MKIENQGEYQAQEPVLVYIRDEIASIPQPNRRLVAVEKIILDASETNDVCINIPKDMLMFTGIDMQKRLENGWFTITVEKLSKRVYVSQ